jgi:hypothetical protein
MKGIVISGVGRVIFKELCLLSKENSCLTNKSLAAIEKFDWTIIATTLQKAAPYLCSLLETCTKKMGLEKNIVIVVCTSILVKSVSARANLLQRLMSVLLFASHAPKQVNVFFSTI